MTDLQKQERREKAAENAPFPASFFNVSEIKNFWMYCAVGVKMASGVISVCIEFWRRSNMKIAIMTFYKEDNYGTVLQAAALRRYLCELGHEADLIRYVSDGRVQTIYKDSVKNEFRKQVREELREERNPVVTGKTGGDTGAADR